MSTTAIPAREDVWIDPVSGRRLAYRLWWPERVRALMVLLHGFGEHSGRYAPFAQQLVKQGIVVAAPDLWGHGRSDGARGDFQQRRLRHDPMESSRVVRRPSNR